MFNLIQGTVDRPFHERKAGPAAVSMVVHAAVLVLVLAVPYLYVTNQLPEVPAMMAFVVPEATIPAPPPPPPPPAARPMQTPVSTKSVVAANPSVAPVEAPSEIKSPPPATELTRTRAPSLSNVSLGPTQGRVRLRSSLSPGC